VFCKTNENFYHNKLKYTEEDIINNIKENQNNFNASNEENIRGFIDKQKDLTKILNDFKVILKEGISKSKYLVEEQNNLVNTPITNTNNYTNNFNNNPNIIKNTTSDSINQENDKKRIETVLRFCGLIDNLVLNINKFISKGNNKNLNNLMNINNNKINDNDNKIDNNKINDNDNRIDNNKINDNDKPSYTNFNSKNEINNFRKYINENLSSPSPPCSNINSNLTVNQINNLCKIEDETNLNLNNENYTYLHLDSFKRKSVYKSLFKNYKNTLNEIILICKTKSNEESVKVKDSNSSVVNNLTNNINFNFNFNIPKYNVNSKSHEYKNNTKKEKSHFKGFNNNTSESINDLNNSKNNTLKNIFNSKKSFIILNNPDKSINSNINSNNNSNTQNSNILSSEIQKNFIINSTKRIQIKNFKNSDFSDYSVLDELNEKIAGLKISSFNNMPESSNKQIKIDTPSKANAKSNKNSVLIQSKKKRAKSLDSNYEEFNPTINSHLPNQVILISRTSNTDFLNTLVNDENISSIKLPTSKIRNVTLENYNKNSKIFITKFINLNSKNLFKKLSINNINKNKEENDLDVSVGITNLNNSHELDNSSSKKLFSNFFRKESKQNKSNRKNKNDKNYFINKNSENKDYVISEKIEDNYINYNNMNEFNIIRYTEEEDDYISDYEDSLENCNLNASEDDEKNVYNAIKFRSKKMLQNFIFKSNQNNDKILSKNNNIICIGKNKKDKSAFNFIVSKDFSKDSNKTENKNISVFNSNFTVESPTRIKSVTDNLINSENIEPMHLLNSDNSEKKFKENENDKNLNFLNCGNSDVNKKINIISKNQKDFIDISNKNIIDLEKLKMSYLNMISKDEYKNDIDFLIEKKTKTDEDIN